MAYDEALAERIRTALGKSREVAEKRIVGGGLGFMRDGKMFVGVMKDDLLVRVEPERRAALLKQTGVRSLRLGGKPTAAYVLIDPAAIGGRAALRTWIELAATSVTTTSQRGAKAKRRKGTIAAAEPDPRIAKLVEVFRADPKLRAVAETFDASSASGQPRKFGSNGLKVDGKLFALFTQGTLVVKLPKERVAALVAKGDGKPFDPGHGRLMKEWLTVVSPKLSWSALAKEAHAFVATA
ncbi:MAG: TfoX/Sxy family protein [Xanthobacteraceae bacterium]|jgi:TfoX/Sxy family transcriptional regulator of competence genes